MGKMKSVSYIVNMNHPGYLPDYDPVVCDDLHEAAGEALSMIDGLTVNIDADAETDVWNLLVELDNGTRTDAPLPLQHRFTDYDGFPTVVFIDVAR